MTFEGGKVLANGHFGRGEMPGQVIHTHFALLVEQGEDAVTALRRIALRHDDLSFVSKDNEGNRNLN